MEDKRIQKTKQKLRETFTQMLQTKTFDQITVTELCEAAKMSRITFYAHYNDKYDLLEALMEQMLEAAQADFEALQKQNNPTRDSQKTYNNILDSILNLFSVYKDLLKQASQQRNPYLYYSFYQRIYRMVERRIEEARIHHQLAPQLASRKFSSFICTGLWAYINECNHEQNDLEQIRRETHTILNGILGSEIFTNRN